MHCQLGQPEGTVFDAVGLSISGGSQKEMAENIKKALQVSDNSLLMVILVREKFRGE